MLGLLGLRIFEATGADIADLGEEHGHRVLRVCGKGSKVVLVPLSMPGWICVMSRSPPATPTHAPRCVTTSLGYCISRARNRRSPGHYGVGIAFRTFG